ncbi:EF-hand and coiled-coil domain-containing protein 1 [Myripristis murdjan]|uniref:EF-hand and coiled-coil domain-containing protein 1 n=1 Tax=Myripristis murdjan TaxID=586833 RepID=UPI0011762A33|nr:EF-hand and coiled-coil domain-containing protein 1-like [Myripristis murdjan]
MERGAVAPSWPRAARKSEWLRGTLAHYHCPDPSVENEIVVLATGIDQYLQEVFHHLAYTNQDDTVSAEDFTALCSVLGLTGEEAGESRRRGGPGDGEEKENDEEFRDVCSGLPCELSFKDFHSRLCGYFRVRSARKATGESAWRLPVTEQTELVERQIRLRWPRVRRRKCVSFDMTKEQTGLGNKSAKSRIGAGDYETEEAAALRELVEDLRSALQGSDARCLALEVALQRERNRSPPVPSGLDTTVTPSSLMLGKLAATNRVKGQRSVAEGGDGVRKATKRRDSRDPLLRELKLIRSSRDGQLEEAMKFNRRLEEELSWAYQQARRLEGVESALRKENTQIRRRAEEAREALRLGLQRVRLIQEQAQSVPELQTRITQLEAELHRYRSCCTCIPDPAHQSRYPMGADDTCSKTDEECLQRAVEGRAASDEEEEDRGKKREEGQHCLLEVKKLISRLHGCGKGCQKPGVHHLLSQGHLHDKNRISTSLDSRGRCSWRGENQTQPEVTNRAFELEKRPEEEARLEDQERRCLTLLEETLTDALTLLLQLRNKNESCRALGRILMDTLDMCSRSGHGPSQVLQVADALCVQLSSSDLLRDQADDEGAKRTEKHLAPSASRQTSSINPLLISC